MSDHVRFPVSDETDRFERKQVRLWFALSVLCLAFGLFPFVVWAIVAFG